MPIFVKWPGNKWGTKRGRNHSANSFVNEGILLYVVSLLHCGAVKCLEFDWSRGSVVKGDEWRHLPFFRKEMSGYNWRCWIIRGQSARRQLYACDLSNDTAIFCAYCTV